MEKLYLTNQQCDRAALRLAEYADRTYRYGGTRCVFGVPRGGVPVAYLVAKYLPNSIVVDSAETATLIVDDIIDSGKTRARYLEKYPKTPFHDLVFHLEGVVRAGRWVVFPWENAENGDTSAEDIVIRLLQYIGEDPKRGGLLETPKRVLKAWGEWCAGYKADIKSVIKQFEDGASGYNEMVTVKDLPFYSHCEHHLAPFFGTATIAYIPNRRILGLSKIERVLDVFARRLQVQERLTTQVADALMEHLEPKGVAVRIAARHLCMESRGVRTQGHHTVTTALRGVFMDSNLKAREEFLATAQQ